MRFKSISKSFQNIVNAFSNIDNAFNETAGRLKSFIEPLLSVIKIFTTRSSTYTYVIYQFKFEQKSVSNTLSFPMEFCRERGEA